VARPPSVFQHQLIILLLPVVVLVALADLLVGLVAQEVCLRGLLHFQQAHQSL
jgi:hypothetical protein